MKIGNAETIKYLLDNLVATDELNSTYVNVYTNPFGDLVQIVNRYNDVEEIISVHLTEKIADTLLDYPIFVKFEILSVGRNSEQEIIEEFPDIYSEFKRIKEYYLDKFSSRYPELYLLHVCK